jgi:hypothetical protein
MGPSNSSEWSSIVNKAKCSYKHDNTLSMACIYIKQKRHGRHIIANRCGDLVLKYEYTADPTET